MNYSNKAGMAMVCMGTALFANASYAAQQVDKPGFYASLSATHTSDDNIFRQADNKTSDTIITVSPELLFIKAFGKHQFTAEYIGDYASYSSTTSENFTDHFVNLDALFDLSKKFNVNVQANYTDGHESRGSSGVETASDADVNEWKENRLFGGLTYGRETAVAQIELDYASTNIAYTNNVQEARDRKNSIVSSRIFYKLANKTKLFVEAKQNTIDYVAATSTLDSTETFYHVGLRWNATYKTTGEFKVGTFDKKFDSAAQTNGNGTSYEASLLWEPKSYSRLTFGLSQSPQESTTADSYYVSSVISVDWQHEFNSKLGLNFNVADTTDDYSGTRKDKLSSSSLGVNYKFRRWMDFGLNFTKSLRDSTDDTADYTDNLVLFTATLYSAR